jgi:poly-gamma-glutamate capsule biosynthesis protein CapA/YwtB (metallophosphatase superfamily)
MKFLSSRLLLCVAFVIPSLTRADMTMVFTGDSIINRRLTTYEAPGYEGMLKIIRDADVAFTNFETLVHDFSIPGAALSGGTYMGSPAYVLDELEWAGFDILGMANNHTGDFGQEGMLSTQRALDKSKLVYAGIGANLARARSPAYVDTKPGRVALISLSSSFPPPSVAGPQRKDMPGRPGLNPLRFTVTYTVDGKTLDAVKHFAGPRGERKTPAGETEIDFLNAVFKAGDKLKLTTTPNAADLAEIVASVKDARQQADWVIVSVHSHENPGHDHTKLPAEFYVTFARAAIDAGADVVVGHGPHYLKGIEIYKGKPILYSLGNFIFENDLVEFQPGENYDKNDLPGSALPGDFFTKRTKGETIGFPATRHFWESVVAELSFKSDRTLSAIKLHPIVLGFGKSRAQRGRPSPASPEDAKRIIEELGALSAPMGAKISFVDGVGVLAVQ